MAQGKAQPSARKRSDKGLRGGLNEAETFVEEIDPALTVPHEMDDLYVDDAAGIAGGAKGKSRRASSGKAPSDRAANGKAANGKAANGKAANGRASAGTAPGGRGASLVDAEGESKKRRKAKRAAERRRARGEAPSPVNGTNTALQQRREPDLGASGQLNYAAGVLTCVKGPEEGLALNLLEGSYTIGRGRENSFVLKDIAASRRHVRVEVAGHKVLVEDMGSGNGTRVNGKRIEKAQLKNGDRVELGNSVLVFTFLGNDESRPSMPPTTSEALAKDAQKRIVEAAERLAAELSERLAAEDDEPGPTAYARGKKSGSGASDRADAGHDENDRIDSAIDEVLTASAAREHRREGGKPPVPMPDALWNETETRIPLSEVVPADEPLRPRERERRASAPSKRSPPSLEPMNAKGGKPARDPDPPSLPTASVPAQPVPEPIRMERVGAPLAAPPQTPAPQAPAVAGRAPPPLATPGPAMVQGVAVRPQERSWLLGVVVAFLAVLLLGGAVGAVYFFLLREPVPDDTALAAVTSRATAALAQGDYAAALAHAEEAQALRPDDAATKALLIAIRTAKAEAEDGGDGKEANAQRGEAKPEPKQVEPEPKQVEPEPKQVEPASKRVEAKAEPKKAEPKKVERRPEPVVRKPKPRPKPRPPRRQERKAPEPRGMSDAEAKSVYIEAMRAVRGDDEQRGCTLIRKVAKEAPSDSNWKAKARNALGRYGCE